MCPVKRAPKQYRPAAYQVDNALEERAIDKDVWSYSMIDASLGYRAPAKIFHWLTAIAVLCALILGISMLNVASGPLQNRLFDLHRSFGALILVIAAGRLLWRL